VQHRASGVLIANPIKQPGAQEQQEHYPNKMQRKGAGDQMTGWEKSDIIAAASAACGIAVFALGIWQYRSSENWQRSEFVAGQIKEFNSDKINNAVLRMMDYDPAHVELFPEKTKSEDRYVDVQLSMLVKAVGQENEFSDALVVCRRKVEMSSAVQS
jgi:hypothetical protein